MNGGTLLPWRHMLAFGALNVLRPGHYRGLRPAFVCVGGAVFSILHVKEVLILIISSERL